MNDKIERKRIAILKILHDSKEPVGSQLITQYLNEKGYDISERTVRHHLLALDNLNLTEYVGRKGRKITKNGITELSKARVSERVGFLAAKIDRMTYRMNFNLEKKSGTVVVNISLIEKKYIDQAFPLMMRVFEEGYAMGTLMTLFGSGEKVGEMVIPDDYIGLGTVCSITLNGVLLDYGIPTYSRFGGLLEVDNKKPFRFVAIINYNGTSLDPLEIFIKSGMTDYLSVVEKGSGLIGASFREVPEESREKVLELAEKLKDVGMGGFYRIGWPGQTLCEIPGTDGIVGLIVIGGLNPVAILEESGIKVHSRALSGLVEFDKLFHYKMAYQKYKEIK